MLRTMEWTTQKFPSAILCSIFAWNLVMVGILSYDSCSLRRCNAAPQSLSHLSYTEISSVHQPSLTAAGSEVLPEQRRCWWQFEKYQPSEFEDAWMKNITSNQEAVCERLWGAYKKYVDSYLAFGPFLTPNSVDSNATTNTSRACPTPVELYSDWLLDPPSHLVVLSRFEYRLACYPAEEERSSAMRHSLVEPLAGTLRHPNACLPNASFDEVVRKDYMYVEGWPIYLGHKAPFPGTVPLSDKTPRGYSMVVLGGVPLLSHTPISFYFDIGASLWTSGAGGASQSWMRSMYSSFCIDFDHYYAWEAKKHDPEEVMRQIPDHVKPKYHWFNVPADPAEGSSNNPLRMILAETAPEDFVVLKLDVDNWRVEEQFVEQILAQPELQGRIDEMFWEHSVNFAPMTKSKYSGLSPDSTHVSFKMEDSIKLFRRLRDVGIRAHSWV